MQTPRLQQMGETGSVSEGGSANVSNVFAGGALWGVDWLFNGAALGYKGMNFQAIGSSFSLECGFSSRYQALY